MGSSRLTVTLTVGLAVLAWMSLGAGRPRAALRVTTGPKITSPPASPPPPVHTETPAPCPPDTLPDGDACVRLPDDDGTDDTPEALTATSSHQDKGGRWSVYEQVPRRPDRPAEYDAYRYPVSCEECVVSGYDLDLPDALQRRGRRLRHVGHGAVDLLQKRGTAVTLVALEKQRGDAEVLFVGSLFGTTVATRHTVREAGQLRDYVVLFGHLEAAAAGVQPGVHVKDGDLIGYVGDSGSPSLVHLHLEARRVRDGVDPAKLTPSALVDGASTIACDPRNVLPLK